MMQDLVLIPDQALDVPETIVQPAANAAINNVHEQMLQILQTMQAAQMNNNGNNNVEADQ